MRRFLMIAVALVACTGFAQAGPILNLADTVRKNIAERRAARATAKGQCQTQAQPVRDFIQAQPIRTAVANGFETTSQVIQQAGAMLRPVCSNGQCPR